MPLPQLDLHRLRAREDQIRRPFPGVGKVLNRNLRVERVHHFGHDLRQLDHLSKQDLATLILFQLLLGHFLLVETIAVFVKVVVVDGLYRPVGAEDVRGPAMD